MSTRGARTSGRPLTARRHLHRLSRTLAEGMLNCRARSKLHELEDGARGPPSPACSQPRGSRRYHRGVKTGPSPELERPASAALLRKDHRAAGCPDKRHGHALRCVTRADLVSGLVSNLVSTPPNATRAVHVILGIRSSAPGTNRTCDLRFRKPLRRSPRGPSIASFNELFQSLVWGRERTAGDRFGHEIWQTFGMRCARTTRQDAGQAHAGS